MSKRMFFFDIDGTLIDLAHNVHRPTPATVECFRQLHARGDHVILATGRAKSLVPPEVTALGFDGYILSNGGYVSFQDQVVADSFLTVDEMEFLDECAEKAGGQLILEDQAKSHVKNPDSPLLKEFISIFSTMAPGVFDDCWDFSTFRPTMGNLVFENEQSMHAFKALVDDRFDVYLFKEDMLYADVTHKGVSKGLGVNLLVEKLGIDRKHTYAFGDGLNDIQMFQSVEHAYAMGRARDRVKKVARFTTSSCQEDGIWNALLGCGAVQV